MTARGEVAAKLILLGFVALFVIFFSRPHGTKAPKLGEVVPNFTLQKDDGKPLNLTDYRGKILVLNFWASWCGPCVDEIPSLNTFADQFADKGVQVLGVSVDEDPEAYMSFLSKYKVTFPTVRNGNRTVSETYGTFKLPETYIISRDGRLRHKVIGPTNWTSTEMVNYVQSLVAGS